MCKKYALYICVDLNFNFFLIGATEVIFEFKKGQKRYFLDVMGNLEIIMAAVVKLLKVWTK